MRNDSNAPLSEGGAYEKLDIRLSPRLGNTVQRAVRERRFRATAAFVVLFFAGVALYTLRTPELWNPFGGKLVEEGGLEVGGTPQDAIEWSVEEQAMREYSWGPVLPHESLQTMVDELSKSQQRVRAWLLRTRPLSQAGVGIGLGSSSPPEDIRPAPRAARHIGMPSSREGPGAYEGGSSSKYGDLLVEWTTGAQATSCKKAVWEDEYTKLHREIISGERPTKILEFNCFQGAMCGGLADRMLGVMSTFLYAVLTGRAFTILWEHPIPFDLLYDSPHINWSRSYSDTSTLPNTGLFSNATFVDTRDDTISAYNWYPPSLDPTFPAWFTAWSSPAKPWISLLVNRGLVLRSFYYPQVRPRLEELGMVYNTAYTCLMNYLIRPKAPVLEFVSQYTSFFSLPSVFVVGIQIRTGDDAMFSPEADQKNTVERHAAYFRCASQAAHTYSRQDQQTIFYLISDSNHLKQDALRAFPGKVVISGLKSKHLEIHQGGVADEVTGLNNAMAEQYVLSGTDFQILTKYSGFGKIATWLRGKPGSTIQLQNPYLPYAGGPEPPLDCGVDSAIDMFSDLSAGWSLG